MQKEGPLIEKSLAFAVKIVFFCREIQENKKEYVLTKQLLKSGTSVGANIEEATQAQSINDFVSKLSIALKEAHETRYWLRIIKASRLSSPELCDNLIQELQEIIKMLVASIKTAKSH